MKRSILAAAIATSFVANASADIVITEYVEGSSLLNALEIANTGSSEQSLDSYEVRIYKDGATTPTGSISLNGTVLPANGVLVIARSTSDAGFTISPSYSPTIIENSAFMANGGDSFTLFDGTSEIDRVGPEGDTNWGKTVTLRRYSQTPTTSFNTYDWESFEINNVADLGNAGPARETPLPAPIINDKSISEIQGSGAASAVPGIDIDNNAYTSSDQYKLTGVVTAIQTTSLGGDLPQGIFIQDQGANIDGDNHTSDALFVEMNPSKIAVGNTVTVTGTVKESFGWTMLVNASLDSIDDSSTTAVDPVPVEINLDDADFRTTLERYENMLVKFDSDAEMRIVRNFGYDYSARRNNMAMSHRELNYQPNQLNVPSSVAAQSTAESNRARRVVIESFPKAPSGQIPYYSSFGRDNGTGATDDYMRIGDTVDGLTGVLTYSYGEYRLFVTEQVTQDNFKRTSNARTESPTIEDGDIKVATFNVLNYFNSPFGGPENPTAENRGATTADDFEKQATKIVNAIIALDADIVGLMEIENNGFSPESAIVDLVHRINDELPRHLRYTIAQSPQITQVGGDAITSQVIYRANKVSLGRMEVVPMPQQHAPEVTYDGSKVESGENFMRDSLVTLFNIRGSNESLAIAVNHFKSKGSTCWEDVQTGAQVDDDYQGSCEDFRVSGAYWIGKHMSENYQGHTLIIGDLNSYAKEDPVLVLTNFSELPDDYVITAARDTWIGHPDTGTPLHGEAGAIIDSSFGYINLTEHLHPTKPAISYSYSDEVGTLDYILASPSLVNNNHVVDITEWNINSLESSLFEYATKYTGDMEKFDDIYRSSDHDPGIVSLNFGVSKDKIVNEAPKVLPSRPINPPAGVSSRPTAPQGVVSGASVTINFDLTDIGETELYVGDRVSLSFTPVSEQSGILSRFAGGVDSFVVLTETDIQQGWVALTSSLENSGRYEMSISVLSAIDNSVIYQTDGETFSVASSTTDSTTSGSGGSLGHLSLYALLCLAWVRRRFHTAS